MNSILQARIDTAFYNNVYRTTEQFFYIQHKPGLIHQASAWFDINQEINIATGTSIASNDGAEELNTAYAVSLANSMDRIAVPTELFECVHDGDR